MSQNKFVSLPVLEVSSSKIFLVVIIVLHLIAVASITYTIYFHVSINVALLILVSCSFYYYIQYYKNLLTLKLVKIRADGLWILGFDKKPILASLETNYMLTEWFIILRFRVGKLKTRSIPLFIDMLPKKKFKQLMVVLPYIQHCKI